MVPFNSNTSSPDRLREPSLSLCISESLCSVHQTRVNGLPTLDAITLKGRGGVVLLFIIGSHTAHLTHKPHSESTESQSGSVHGRERKAALDRLKPGLVIGALDPPCSPRDWGTTFIVIASNFPQSLRSGIGIVSNPPRSPRAFVVAASNPPHSPRDGGTAIVVVASNFP